MSPETPARQKSPAPSSEKEGSSASAREANYVENIAPTKERDADDDKAELAKEEGVVRDDQDTRVQTIRQQAKEAGAGSKQPSEHLNQDG